MGDIKIEKKKDKEVLAIEKDRKASEESIKKAEEEALKIKSKEEIEEVQKIPVEEEVLEIKIKEIPVEKEVIEIKEDKEMTALKIKENIEILNKCEKCGQICPTFESLIEHHIRTDYIQCGICHKEFETEYDLEDHEETHRDSPWSDFICETCGEAIPYKDYAEIHYFCHNTPEILKGIRKYKGNIFKLMVKIA